MAEISEIKNALKLVYKEGCNGVLCDECPVEDSSTLCEEILRRK